MIGSLPIILLSVLVAAQIAIAGAAERALPEVLRHGLKVSGRDGVRVGVRVPGLIPGFPETHVYGSSSLGGG